MRPARRNASTSIISLRSSRDDCQPVAPETGYLVDDSINDDAVHTISRRRQWRRRRALKACGRGVAVDGGVAGRAASSCASMARDRRHLSSSELADLEAPVPIDRRSFRRSCGGSSHRPPFASAPTPCAISGQPFGARVEPSTNDWIPRERAAPVSICQVSLRVVGNGPDVVPACERHHRHLWRCGQPRQAVGLFLAQVSRLSPRRGRWSTDAAFRASRVPGIGASYYHYQSRTPAAAAGSRSGIIY